MTEIIEAEPATSEHGEHHLVGQRAQRRHRRQRRFRIAAAFVAAALVAGALGTVGWLRWKDSDDASAQTIGSATSSARRDVAEPATQTVATRALTSADPLRLWIAGDSLAGALGPSLGEITAKTGVVQPQFDSRVSSGLASNGVINWQQHARNEITRLNPEVIVFIIGTNDYPVGLSANDMASYEEKADAMMSLLTEGDRPVYWIGPPVLQNDKMNRGASAVNETFKRLAPKHKSLTFVDGYKVFGTEDGKYVASLPDDNGAMVRVRAGDGVHFTDAGGDRLAKVVFDLMDQTWRISAQAVPSQPKPVLETSGSSRVPVNQNRRSTPAPAQPAPRVTTGNTTAVPNTTAPPGTTAAPTTVPATTAPPSTTTKPSTTAPPATSTG